ncbi:MAG TPA: MFS transporter [Crenalkalicoccus sp.]|jgi:MFS family permease|nr:MFS transporter [Crenalkalicoccus sp.]
MSGSIGLPAGYDYRRIWFWLCLGWLVSSMDRTITGPVITWMIQNKVAFMATENPYALGGLIGSIFFAGYMLTQFPGGYAGDRHGHRSVIIISLFWASVATLVSGLAGTLVAFIAARIFTGLGEGVYYANDRTVIAETTPVTQRSLAMGVVITGLSIGITLATLGGAWLIEIGRPVLGDQEAWRMPFFVLSVVSLLIAWGVGRELWITRRPADDPGRALGVLGRYAAVFFVLIFGLFLISEYAGLPSWGLTVLELLLAFGLIAFVYSTKGEELAGAVRDRSLVLIYVSFIPILWNLWFFGFWAISIVSSGAEGSFMKAALTAMFTGLSGIIGYPLGGWLADRTLRSGLGRKPILLGFTLAQGLITIGFAYYLQEGGQSLAVMALLLFVAGLFFNALQPVSHAMVADLAAPEQRGSAFGTYNLIGEIGAVLSPTISGTLRDYYGGWAPAVYLDGVLILLSFLCVVFVREATRARALGPQVAPGAP